MLSGEHSPQRQPVFVLGLACRLPGAKNEGEFWRLLDEGICTVAPQPEGRWNTERFLHERRTEPGFAYSFAGSYLDNPYDFDPAPFGISPREAKQIDPQQRILLEVVSEALENAGLTAASLAGKDVGVFVGASSLDHANLHLADPASIESHFMTGNTLSVVSNRISYTFDWHGPSFTVDTACSSSLVALSEAVAAIRAGTIDIAVVAGVNLLLSPASFIGFSRASMLSPTGLCRPFSANSDGYVRAEGAVALVLVRPGTLVASNATPRSVILGAGVNSDGRTSGIALPSADGQRRLLDRLYPEAGVSPDALAFVEAHGTGTAVGDPAEASAIGQALGRHRSEPLPIGAGKSNVGHLEPASGLVGVVKAILSMEHRRIPKILHLQEASPHIDFAALNLVAAREAIDIPPSAIPLHCGVSSFGFGGTNAHVILREATAEERAPVAAEAPKPELLVVSAHTREALLEAARNYGDLLAVPGVEPGRIAAAAAFQRDRLAHRIVVPLAGASAMAESLLEFANAKSSPGIIGGRVIANAGKVAFAYSGNGSQWAGMGRAGFARNAVFRQRIIEVDETFKELAGWSIAEAITSGETPAQLAATSAAQPLIFAIQSAATAALADRGLIPDIVFGHSAGEVAAAAATGAITLEQAIRIIHRRSEHQEAVRGRGTMAVVARDLATVESITKALGLHGVEIAAVNSPASVTVSGDADQIRTLAKEARARRIAMRVLDIEYPFHSSLLDELEEPLLAALSDISPTEGGAIFVSTVTGGVVPGSRLDTHYWWRNVRAPVLFQAATETAARLGAGLFVEIGARPIVNANIADTLKDGGLTGEVVQSFSEKDDRDPIDPLLGIVARAFVRGATIDEHRLFGSIPAGRTRLPTYPWQHKAYTPEVTAESVDLFSNVRRHPLIGGRLSAGTTEWRHLIDPSVVPYLADHRVERMIIMPGSGLAEMALAAARELWPDSPVSLENFDILQPMAFSADHMREVSVRYAGTVQLIEIWSRQRLVGDDWVLHARCRIGKAGTIGQEITFDPDDLTIAADSDEIYKRAAACGLDYGPTFRRVRTMRRNRKVIDASLEPVAYRADASWLPEILHPAALDAAFHSLFHIVDLKEGERRTYLPIRFGALRVYQDSAPVVRAVLSLIRETDERISIDAVLHGEDGEIVATLSSALFRTVILSYGEQASAYFRVDRLQLSESDLDVGAITATTLADPALALDRSDAWLLTGAFLLSLAHRALLSVVGTASFAIAALMDLEGIAPAAIPLISSLLDALAQSGLAQEADGIWALEAASNLPEPEAILAEFIVDDPSASAEAILLAQTLKALPAFIRDGNPLFIRAPLLEQFEISALFFRPLFARMHGLIEAALAATAHRPLRILVAEPGAAGLLKQLSSYLHDGRIQVTLAGADKRKLAHVVARAGARHGIELLELAQDGPPGAGSGSFEMAFAFTFMPLFGDDPAPLRRLSQHLSGSAALVVLQPPQDPIIDLLFGMTEGWFAESLDPALPIGRLPSTESTRRLLASAFEDVVITKAEEGTGTLLLASRCKTLAAIAQRMDPVIIATGTSVDSTVDAGTLAQRFQGEGRIVIHASARFGADRRAAWQQLLTRAGVDGTIDIIELYAIAPEGPDRQRIEAGIGEIGAILNAASETKAHIRLWVVVSGGAGRKGAHIDPVADAIASFCRVAINEYPTVELRVIDLARDLPAQQAVPALADLIATPSAERELLIDSTGVHVPRVARGLTPGQGDAAEAARLAFPRPGMIDSFVWNAADRIEPAPGEIEVEIGATGLNFRDVMLAMGLLDDDVLDDGLAGPVFGFECAGHVVRVGEGATAFRVGDPVMGFAARAFATHVTTPARMFVPAPQGLSIEAAATVPVAFLTAWYALVELAAIRPGQWVLIHGAAGGVGLAAIQIARLKGARVAATVGSDDKRALVEFFGAEHVYNSRSLDFADAVQADIGGVDVVLNSLFGDAMLASLACLKPFGRFIELGKRDYVANTMLGLRPFRRNLTYFGVDVDQLLAHRSADAERMMRDLAEVFAAGDLTPLLHRIYESDEIATAFRQMQAASHVGKIVVRPPPAGSVCAEVQRAAFQPREGVHLVVGGTRGFGFETALWLLDKGATKVVVASRTGHLDPIVEARAEKVLSDGRLIVESVDLTIRHSVTALVDRIAKAHGAIRGVVHSAMVLQDGLIAMMDAKTTTAVLAPKVEGALYLDRATRGMVLDYFVLFSSATTLIGNPGQAAYVAANGYLQGIARKRHAEGLPALAVAWGAIADAGVLARNLETAAKLERATGVIGMPAADALAHLGRLLTDDPRRIGPVAYCADIRPGPVMRELALLSTPAFADFIGGDSESESGFALDVAALIDGKSDQEARGIIANLVAEEVARILRLAVEDIDLHRPFSEIGMDSLMALELKMSIEKKLDVELPVVAITALKNLDGLAGHVLAKLRESGDTPAGDAAMDASHQVLLAQQISGDVEMSDIANVVAAVEQRRQKTKELL